MFLHRLEANDSRFKTLEFREGLNLLVAVRTEDAPGGASRNGTGKTSFVHLLRYLLGGSISKQLNVSQLKGWTFTLTLTLPSSSGGEDVVRVTRPISPQTHVKVNNWSVLGPRGTAMQPLQVSEWRDLLGKHLFRIPEDAGSGLTSGSLWARLIRTYFGDPTRGFQTDPDWVSGLRTGYLLGLDASSLAKAGEVVRLDKQKKALTAAIKEGALSHLELDEGKLRAELSSRRRRRNEMAERLAHFRVDENYQDRQRLADESTAQIRDLNDEELALRRRLRQAEESLVAEPQNPRDEDDNRLERMYSELGLVFRESAIRRYDEVREFYASVIRSRRRHLESDVAAIRARLEEISRSREALDSDRARHVEFLRGSVAFDTFLAAQRQLGEEEAAVAEAEKQLASAADINGLGNRLAVMTAEAGALVRQELQDRQEYLLSKPLAMFNSLGAEIYDGRVANLIVSEGKFGMLKVIPEISGDASEGIRGVETFLLDTVCLCTAKLLDRAPGVLVHDSHLYDAVDHRQVASCLNIGARLADQRRYQYVVTMNSDFLASVEGEGEFDSSPYRLPVELTDSSDDGGLFGFRFD